MNRPSPARVATVWLLLLAACVAVDYGVYRLMAWWL